jgi:hypothetical protein
LIKHNVLPAKQSCVGAPYVIREIDLDLQEQARDILPRNIRLKLSFTIHTTLAPENASSRSDESFTEVAFIMRSSRRMVAVYCCRRG